MKIQKNRTRKALAGAQDIYDLRLKKQAEALESRRRGRKVVKGKYTPWQQGRQGVLKWYVSREIENVALNTMNVFCNEIRTHGGKHVHAGGTNIFVLKGKGYSVVEGVRHDWEAGDLIMLPVMPGGVEHQHFNLEDKPSKWVALLSVHFHEVLGEGIKQKETHPEWKGKLAP